MIQIHIGSVLAAIARPTPTRLIGHLRMRTADKRQTGRLSAATKDCELGHRRAVVEVYARTRKLSWRDAYTFVTPIDLGESFGGYPRIA